jgi:hypothetical protein
MDIVPTDKHRDRVSKYQPYLNGLNLNDLSFPMPISEIPTFEENNNNISMNVFSYSKSLKNEAFFPIYTSKFQFPKLIELLLSENNQLNGNTQISRDSHYILITDFNKLVSNSAKVDHERKRKTNYLIICRKCVTPFYLKDSHDTHASICLTNKTKIHYQILRTVNLNFKIYSNVS